MRACSLLLVVVVSAPSLALAQEATPPAGDPTLGPGFVTIDRFDRSSRAGLELSDLFSNNMAGLNLSNTTVLRIEPHGQYVDPASGLGGYATLPIAHVSGNGSSTTATGDAELGGIYVPRLSVPNVGLVLHAGLTLPTGSTSNDGVLSNVLAAFTRLDDYYLIIPKGWSLRVGVSPMIRSGNLFARADLGVDANLSASSSTTADTVIRLDAGAGVLVGQVAVMAEVTNLHAGGNNGGWIDTGAISARFLAGSVQPYGALVFPLDHDANQIMSAGLTVGLEGRLQ